MPTFRLPVLRHAVVGVILLSAAACGAFADAVTDWNTAFENSLLIPSERGPALPDRPLTIMHAAMFDAVNGIDGKYTPLHVTNAAPPGARAEAAAIQAAYTVLTALRGNLSVPAKPAAQAVWDAQLTASLGALAGAPGASESIARGREWGTTVANAILAWRTGDIGAIPGTVAGPATAGSWQFTADARPWAGRDALVTTPFVLSNTWAFDPGPPYGLANRTDALASAAYAADVNEVQAHGGATGSVRTAAEEFEALFLHAADLASLNRLMRSLVSPHARLVDNARAFALVNLAWYDAKIVLFHSKYQHQLWRPFQAINNADLDGRADTIKPAATWTSLRPTPPHPEYPSAHVTLYTAVLQVATRLFGDSHEVEFFAPGFANPVTYGSLAAISNAAVDARVNIGYHFRETGEVSQVVGRAIGDAIVESALQPISH